LPIDSEARAINSGSLPIVSAIEDVARELKENLAQEK
jgi:hypothetical protein